jgi:hypothetical protein
MFLLFIKATRFELLGTKTQRVVYLKYCQNTDGREARTNDECAKSSIRQSFLLFFNLPTNVSFININQFSYLYVATKTRNKVEKKLQINNFSIKDLFLCVTPTKTRFQVR